MQDHFKGDNPLHIYCSLTQKSCKKGLTFVLKYAECLSHFQPFCFHLIVDNCCLQEFLLDRHISYFNTNINLNLTLIPILT